MGVIAAIIIYVGQNVITEGWSIMKAIGTEHWSESDPGAWLSFGMVILLMIYMYWDSKRAKAED